MDSQLTEPRSDFDFEGHRRRAVSEYAMVWSLYDDLASVVRDILEDALERKALKVSSVEARAKKFDSFGQKAASPSDRSLEEPKYRHPLQEITDLAGVRVITFFPRQVSLVGECIREEFDVVECVDHAATRQQEERLGYLSVHHLIRLRDSRTRLPEYKKFASLVAEIQVRTVMQHAWAEIEHDIQYKSSVAIPQLIRRRLMTLAGLLEIADHEFEAIQDADTILRGQARQSVKLGQLEQVEITPDAVRAYLEQRVGPDDRISDWRYSFTADTLRHLGFSNLKQVDDCISKFNDDTLSRTVHGNRQGQIERFALMLQAGMGDNYLKSHPWRDLGWFRDSIAWRFEKMRSGGVAVDSYCPPAVQQSVQPQVTMAVDPPPTTLGN